jgi:hypothetical protein
MALIRLEMSVHSGTPLVSSSTSWALLMWWFISLSFGQTQYGKLAAQKTGAVPQSSFNPFAQQQQQQTQNNEQPFFSI